MPAHPHEAHIHPSIRDAVAGNHADSCAKCSRSPAATSSWSECAEPFPKKARRLLDGAGVATATRIREYFSTGGAETH